MSTPGFVADDGKVYFRCEKCGDSSNPNRAHAFIDLQGNTYCYRCGESSKLSMQQWLYVQLELSSIEEVIAPDWEPYPLNKLYSVEKRRDTLLDRYVVPGNDDAEAFSMRDSKGNLIGYHSRFPNKFMVNEGNRGICWPGADNEDGPLALVSSTDNPLYIVEGPYDCTRPRRVSAMGSISRTVFKHLKGQSIWAWPDPDIIETAAKRAKFIEMLNVANDNYCWVQGLIVSDKDPDSATFKQKVSLHDANKYVRNETWTSMSMQQT